jgi:putative ABC transport system permease protein
MKFLSLIVKNLRRNKVRTALTALAVVFLVVIFSMIATVLRFLNLAMTAQAKDVALVITERYRFPSRFDRRYLEQIAAPGSSLHQRLRTLPGFHADQCTLWNFAAFTLDPEAKDKDLQVTIIATLPDKMRTMIGGLETLDAELCARMQKPPRSRQDNIGILVGPDRLAKLNKKVGDVFKALCLNLREGVSGRRQLIEMEFEVVGELPAQSQWASGAFMDYAYLDRVLKEKKNEFDGMVNLGWVKVDDPETAEKLVGLVEHDVPDVKCETASAGVSRFLEPYKGLLDGIKFLLIPAIMVVMTVIVANAISITVRERTTEMAVLKVLGFRPPQILALVLGEGVLLGAVGGLVGVGLTYWLINQVAGGIKIPFAFFPIFFVPVQVFWWGPALGAATAFLGGIVPAWHARGVKVSEVFSKVT